MCISINYKIFKNRYISIKCSIKIMNNKTVLTPTKEQGVHSPMNLADSTSPFILHAQRTSKGTDARVTARQTDEDSS
jgi:hypothetical protein